MLFDSGSRALIWTCFWPRFETDYEDDYRDVYGNDEDEYGNEDIPMNDYDDDYEASPTSNTYPAADATPAARAYVDEQDFNDDFERMDDVEQRPVVSTVSHSSYAAVRDPSDSGSSEVDIAVHLIQGRLGGWLLVSQTLQGPFSAQCQLLQLEAHVVALFYFLRPSYLGLFMKFPSGEYARKGKSSFTAWRDLEDRQAFVPLQRQHLQFFSLLHSTLLEGGRARVGSLVAHEKGKHSGNIFFVCY